MHRLVAWLAALLFFSVACPVRSETPAISDYMTCARALGVTIDDQFAIFPGERSGDKGLYIFTDLRVFFLPLGTPAISSGDAQEYFLKTSVPSIGDMYIDFRDGKPGNYSKIQPAISYQTMKASEKIAASYREASVLVVRDDSARKLLRQRLRDRISVIKNFLDDKNSYSAPGEAKAAFEKDRAIYLAKLETCRIGGDPELSLVVAEEMKKLKDGFPGASVWERQIGDANARRDIRIAW